MRRPYNHADAGFTMLEAVIVLGVVAVALGGLWAAASHVWHSSRGEQIQNQITIVAQNMRDHFGPMGRLIGCVSNYTAIVDDNDRNLIPLEMRSQPSLEGRAINHAMGSRTGAANAGTFRVSCLNNTSFRISVRDLDKEVCARLLGQFPVLSPTMRVTRMAGPSGSTNIDARNIVSPTGGGGVSLPLSLVMAQAWCSSSTSNEVSFDFALRN